MGAETLKATATILSMIVSHSIKYNAGKIVITFRGYCRHPYPSAGFLRGEWLSLKPIIERSSKICSTMP